MAVKFGGLSHLRHLRHARDVSVYSTFKGDKYEFNKTILQKKLEPYRFLWHTELEAKLCGSSTPRTNF